MRNPLKKEDNSHLVVMIAVGALVAGALAYLLLKDNGNVFVRSVKHRLNDEGKDLAADVISKKSDIKKKFVKKAMDQVSK